MEKRRDIRNIYITPEFVDIWKKFVKICDREGKSASEHIREFIDDYVKRHEPGNPIIPLDRFNGQLLRTCELCGRPENHLWNVLYVSGKTLRSCKPCIESRRPKGLVRKVLQLA